MKLTGEELQACYARLFSTPDGQRVIESLQTKFSENTEPLGDDLIRHKTGQRSVISFINQMIEKGRK